jgi:hypothetical protein
VLLFHRLFHRLHDRLHDRHYFFPAVISGDVPAAAERGRCGQTSNPPGSLPPLRLRHRRSIRCAARRILSWWRLIFFDIDTPLDPLTPVVGDAMNLASVFQKKLPRPESLALGVKYRLQHLVTHVVTHVCRAKKSSSFASSCGALIRKAELG